MAAGKKKKQLRAEFSQKLCPDYVGFSLLMIVSLTSTKASKKQQDLWDLNIYHNNRKVLSLQLKHLFMEVMKKDLI